MHETLSSKVKGYIDFVTYDNDEKEIKLKGWCFLSTTYKPVTKLRIGYVNTNSYGGSIDYVLHELNCNDFILRKDVAKFYSKNSVENCGFLVNLKSNYI